MTALRAALRMLPALALVALTAPSAALAAVEQGHGYGFPRDISLDGYRIDRLINSTMIFVIILFVITCAWIAWVCIKHGRSHVATYEHGDGRKPVMFALGLSALIFFVVDGNLFYFSIKDLDEAFWNFKPVYANPHAIRIEVNGRQWAWDARYAGPDGEFSTPDDIVTFNDIRVPKGVPVIIQLGATDVLHSLYLPNLRQKMDAVPGQINKLWFQAMETGEFDVGCTQHCGVNHYLMKARLTVLEPDQFETWQRQASAISAVSYDKTDEGTHWGWAWKER